MSAAALAMRPARRPARADGGFTLTEALVALAIFGLLSAMIASVLTMQLRADASLRGRMEADDRVVQAQTLLRERMDAMRAVVDIHGSGDTVTLYGLPDRLDFTAPAWRSEGPHALYIYHLMLGRNGTLVLAAQNELAQTAEGYTNPAMFPSVELLDNVARIELTYYGPDRFTGRDAWQERWTQRRALPKLIRLKVAFAPGDPRVWPVLMVQPAPQVRLPCREDNTSRDCGGPT